MKRSVIHIIQPTDGGVPRYVAGLARLQSDAGWRVEVAAPSPGPLHGSPGAKTQFLPWEAKRAPGPSMAAEARALRSILKRSKAEIIHLHSAKAGVVGRWVLKGRRPTVFQPHSWTFDAVPGPSRRLMIGWERWGARWCDRIVCVSESEKHSGLAAGIQARWAVVPNGVDLTKWRVPGPGDREAARRQLDVTGDPLVVSVGRVRRQKGHDVLLEAWPRVLQRVPSAQLVIVGDGPERPSLMRRGVSRVMFAGELPDARQWVVAADVVALPSRYEGMSLAMLEAMATATSVVTTEVAGAREAMGTESGAIVPIEDPLALADAISERLLDPDLAGREGRAARARIERSHSFESTADRMIAVYETVSAEREDPAIIGRHAAADD